MIDTYKIQEKIINNLKKAGVDCHAATSGKSESKYVITELCKIRISNHELPSYYDPSDINLDHARWWGVVARVCDMHNVEYPAAVKALLTKEKNEEAATASLTDELLVKFSIAEMNRRFAAGEMVANTGKMVLRKQRSRIREEIKNEFNKTSFGKTDTKQKAEVIKKYEKVAAEYL